MNVQSMNGTLNERLPYIAFGVLTLVVIGLMAILCLSRDTFALPYQGRIRLNPASFFQPFFGGVYPLLVILLVAVVGFLSLGFLQSRGWFEILYLRESTRGFVVAAVLATLFGIEVVIAESTNIFRMPADMNVPLPWSILFYPVMAYVVEVVFHALPLALLLAVLRPVFKEQNANTLVWSCILIVSLIEPIFQMASGGRQFSWSLAYVGLHIFAINLLQLYVFKRYDFFSMYTFRLIYYLYWHILWGTLRLRWLF